MKSFDKEELADALGKAIGVAVAVGGMYLLSASKGDMIHSQDKRLDETVMLSDSTKSVVGERTYILTKDDYHKMDIYRIPQME